MRKFLSFLLAAALSAAAGCGGGGSPPGILKVGNGAEPEALDPHLVTGIPEHHILQTLFEGLVNLDPSTLEPVPGVAESWDVSDDGIVYTFHLRDDAKWSNGDPVTAHDFLYAWQRILEPELASQYAYMLYAMKNARAYNEGAVTDFAQVGAKALDDRTVEVTLEAPTPYFMTLHTHYTWYPIHRPTIEKFDAYLDRASRWTRPGNIVSNGPFVLEEWVPKQTLKVAKNPMYWDAENVQLEGIWFYPIHERQTEERMFRAGELHMTESVPPHKVPVYQRENPELIRVEPWLGSYFYRINTTRPPLDEPRVRLALGLAIDRKSIVEDVMQGGQLPGRHLVPPGMLGYMPEEYVVYDPDRARALLAEAGYPGGQGLRPLEILYNTEESHRTVAEAIQAMWKETLGVEAELVNQDWKVYLDTTDRMAYDLARAGWIGDFVDPVNFLECFTTGNGNNRTGWGNAEYDRLVEAARHESDLDERNRLYAEAEALLMSEMPIIPIYIYTRVFLIDPSVKGRETNLMDYISFKSLRLEPPAGE